MLSVLTFNTGLTEIRLFLRRRAALARGPPRASAAPCWTPISCLQELVPQRVKKPDWRRRSAISIPTRRYRRGHPLLWHRAAHSLPLSDRRGLVHPIRGRLRRASSARAGSAARCTPGLGRCRVINLHATGRRRLSATARRGAPDRRQIAEAIDAAGASFEGTVVLAGDFNNDPATDPATGRRLAAAGFVDVAACLPDDARPPGTWDPANPPAGPQARRGASTTSSYVRSNRARGRGERCAHRPRRAGGAGARRRRAAPFRPLRPARHAHARLTAGAMTAPFPPSLACAPAHLPFAPQGGERRRRRMGCSPLAEPGPWCGGGCRLCAPKLRHAKRSPTEHDTTELDHCADRALGDRAVSSPPPGPRNPAYPT